MLNFVIKLPETRDREFNIRVLTPLNSVKNLMLVNFVSERLELLIGFLVIIKIYKDRNTEAMKSLKCQKFNSPFIKKLLN